MLWRLLWFYVKFLSQLFGDRQMINATGCSTIYSTSIPFTSYIKSNVRAKFA